MLSEYIRAALRKAKYEILPDDGQFYGEIPGLRGVYAHAPTLEECREQLKTVLEDWLLVCLSQRIPVPAVDGIELRVKEVA